MAFADTAKLIASLELKDAFTPALKKAGKTLDGFDAKLDKSASRGYQAGQQIGTGIKNVAKIAIASVGTLTGLLLLSAKEGAHAADVQNVYNQAIKNSGKISADYVKALDAQSLALSNLSGQDDELIRQQQTRLIQMGLTGAQITKLLPLIFDAAKSTGRDVDAITLAVGRAVQGSATSLGKLGIIVPKAAKATKSAALTSLELAKAQLLIKENQEKAQGPLSKSERAYYAQKKATLDAAIGQQKLTDATKKSTAATKSSFDTVLGALRPFQGVNAAVSGNLSVRLDVLRERLQDVREEAGIKLLPVLTRIVDVVGQKLVPAFGQFINALLPTAITGLDKLASFLEGGGATEGVNAVLDTIKTLAPAIQRSAEITGKVITTAVNLFKSLPPELQGLLVTGLAINKLTGGLVTNIAGGTIDALSKVIRKALGTFAERGGTPANPLFVADVAGGLPGGGLPGGAAASPGGGLLATAAGIGVGTVAILAIAPVVISELAIALSKATGADVRQAANRATINDRRQAEARREIAANPTTAAAFTQRMLGVENRTYDSIENFRRGATNQGDRSYDSIEKLRITSQNGFAGVVGGISKLAAATRLARLALYAREKAILKFTNDPGTGKTHLLKGGQFAIPALTRLKGADLLTVADALTSKFTRSQAPFYRSSVNQERTLRGLREAQRLAIARGDTKTASRLSNDIRTLKTHVDRVQSAIKNKTSTINVPVTITNKSYFNGRLVESATARYLSSVGTRFPGLI